LEDVGPTGAKGHADAELVCEKWSGRVDLNHRPPGPEDWSHEESTT
jgi:hypothetical protein